MLQVSAFHYYGPITDQKYRVRRDINFTSSSASYYCQEAFGSLSSEVRHSKASRLHSFLDDAIHDET
eukprot:62034-Hanusia_phi.AAC.1